MWYKNFSKQSWNLRVWRYYIILNNKNRKANLYYNQDDIGMFKTKGILRWKDTIFRVCRSEAAVLIYIKY